MKRQAKKLSTQLYSKWTAPQVKMGGLIVLKMTVNFDKIFTNKDKPLD